jgi:hypothetical protein
VKVGFLIDAGGIFQTRFDCAGLRARNARGSGALQKNKNALDLFGFTCELLQHSDQIGPLTIFAVESPSYSSSPVFAAARQGLHRSPR